MGTLIGLIKIDPSTGTNENKISDRRRRV